VAADGRGDAATAGELGHRLNGAALAGAARRFGTLFGIAAGVTIVGSMLIALAGGATVRRALSLGFYVVGSFLLLAGFFVGNRGRARVDSGEREEGGAFRAVRGARRVRAATADEQRETVGTSAVFIALGLVLLALGIAFDSEHALL
jgi:hypothetical protein